ncbi:MAG: DNA internalization-related competence protein ComEC/Rec2 [Clostridiales bacterium]|nr:DNA internalization-related competence protein ComEC/Rec2 [Clostridiales bacterium]
MTLENRRHLCLFALTFLFGIILYCRKEDVWPALLAVLGASVFRILKRGRRRRETVTAGLLAAGFGVTAFLLCMGQDLNYERIQNAAEFGTRTELTGTVYKKEIKSNNYLYYLRTTSYKKVLVYSDSDEIPIGSYVTVYGDAEAFPSATNDGNFDSAEYYRCQDISFRVYADEITLQKSRRVCFREALYQFKKNLSAVFAGALNERDAGVLATLVAGNRGMMDQEVKELYQSAGISHILAISGLHISILGMGVFRFLRRLRCPYPAAAGVGSAVVICFVVMSGMGVASCRALIMYLLIMGAEVLGRAYDAANALALAALLLLICNPMSLYQSGFQFSFLAMAAIVLSSAVTQKRQERMAERRIRREIEAGAGNEIWELRTDKEERIWRTMAQKGLEHLWSGAFLQLFLLPLTAWYYYEVPLYAMFLNLLVIPLCSWLLGFGLLGGITGLFFPQIAKWIFVVCHFILLLYEKSIAVVNQFPFSQVITGKPSAWMLLFYYAVAAGVCAVYLYKEKWEKQVATGGLLGAAGRKRLWVAVSFLPVYMLCFVLFFPRREFCRIDFLDVGQGDGIYLTDGRGTHVMIDGGSSSESEVGIYRIEPFLKYHRVQEVDVWILTHSDEDHYSGLLELLNDGYEIEYLLLAQSLPRDETWKTLTEAARENGTTVVYAEEGDVLRLSGCEMTCLYPSAKDTSDDSNALSQVWLFEKEGMSALFTGDVGEEQEQLLLERNLLTDIVVLKAAHHGSKYSSCAEFLEAASPEYAVISCGEGNSYGHPHAETLERLEMSGCEILQTQDSGQITFYEKGGAWKVRLFLEAE